jgi:thioredoxin-related protein
MLLVAKEYQKAMKDGTQDVKELAEYLMKTQSVYELAMSLAELMIDVESSTPRKIVVSQEELNTILSVFRVRGIAEDGTPIKSGRKKKEKGA